MGESPLEKIFIIRQHMIERTLIEEHFHNMLSVPGKGKCRRRWWPTRQVGQRFVLGGAAREPMTLMRLHAVRVQTQFYVFTKPHFFQRRTSRRECMETLNFMEVTATLRRFSQTVSRFGVEPLPAPLTLIHPHVTANIRVIPCALTGAQKAGGVD